MAEELLTNGLDVPAIKTEPSDETAHLNGVHGESDCEDISYFTQTEVDNTRKCLENTRLIIKDFETQLDWHLQQYMTLRNVFGQKGGREDNSKRQDLLSISQLSAMIANHPEGNKKFIKRKVPLSNGGGGGGGKRRRKNQDSESEEETDLSDEDSEDMDDEDFDEEDSEAEDDPATKKRTRGGRKKHRGPEVKDEIEEEIHELVEPKEEMDSEEEEEEEEYVPKKTPNKRGAAKKVEAKTPAKRGGRGKKQAETVDLTSIKKCQVMLDRMGNEVEVKDELDRDELIENLQSKAITTPQEFSVPTEKPVVVIKQENLDAFDFDQCKTNTVVVTFDTKEALPELVFSKNVSDHILDDTIKLVQNSVYDKYLSG